MPLPFLLTLKNNGMKLKKSLNGMKLLKAYGDLGISTRECPLLNLGDSVKMKIE